MWAVLSVSWALINLSNAFHNIISLEAQNNHSLICSSAAGFDLCSFIVGTNVYPTRAFPIYCLCAKNSYCLYFIDIRGWNPVGGFYRVWYVKQLSSCKVEMAWIFTELSTIFPTWTRLINILQKPLGIFIAILQAVFHLYLDLSFQWA